MICSLDRHSFGMCSVKKANSFLGLSKYIVMMFPPREIIEHYSTKIHKILFDSNVNRTVLDIIVDGRINRS